MALSGDICFKHEPVDQGTGLVSASCLSDPDRSVSRQDSLPRPETGTMPLPELSHFHLKDIDLLESTLPPLSPLESETVTEIITLKVRI